MTDIASLNDQFSSPIFFHGKKLLELGRVNPSFFKANLPAYVIISGIIDENNTKYETKLTVKNQEDKTKFTSQCTCKLWNSDDHCAHSVALWLKCLDLLHSQDKLPNLMTSYSSTEGVTAERFGTIVKTPQQLHGSKMNSTFTSLYYTLTNRKNIAFDSPKKFEGKLVLNFHLAEEDQNLLPLITSDRHFSYVWSYVDQTGQEIKEISLFDVHYLFNWRTGDFYYLPTDIAELVRKLKIFSPPQDIDEFLRLTKTFEKKDFIELQMNGTPFSELELSDMKWNFFVDETDRKSFLKLKVQLTNPENQVLHPPMLLQLWASEGGWLNSFRQKNDAMAFIKTLCLDFDHETQLYKKHIHPSSKKVYITEWLDLIFAGEDILHFDLADKKLYRLDTVLFKKLMLALEVCFQDQAFKSSFFHMEDRNVALYIPKNVLMEGLTSFYQQLLQYDIPLYYRDQAIKTWKNTIRFERQKNHVDWFEVDLIVNSEDYELIKNADIQGNYFLSTNGLTLLTDKERDLLRFMKRYVKSDAEEKKEGDGIRRFGLSLKRARVFELFELKKFGIEGALTPEEEAFCERVLTMQNMPQYPLPERYVSIARPYQVTGYQWLRFLYEHKFGACLADDMGLGKTLQTIMLLQSLKSELKKVLIISPVSILFNWKSELEKFSDLKYSIYYGQDRDIDSDAQIILTTYGLLKREALTSVNGDPFDIVIFDEVQHLKNIRSLGANAARQLKAKFRICLTGTPVENDLSEFFNIMDLSVPGVWGELSLIKSQTKNRLIARQTVKPFILRRTKAQVLQELPEKIENLVYLDFNDEEKQYYADRLKDIQLQMLNTQYQKRYGDILKSLLELRQLCLWQSKPHFKSTKIDFLIENLEQILEEGHKVIVFSQFTTYLDFIQNKIRERNWKYSRIDGSQTIKKRSEEVERFQNGDSQIFIISLKAGGFGLNLTAASYIFLMDPWWNPAVEKQAIDRAHRIGQENKLTVYRPIIKHSVEEKVLVLQQAKSELFNDLMAEDNQEFYSGKLTMDDFKNLLS
jgi:SNF2 family DNA or RNA helicase